MEILSPDFSWESLGPLREDLGSWPLLFTRGVPVYTLAGL